MQLVKYEWLRHKTWLWAALLVALVSVRPVHSQSLELKPNGRLHVDYAAHRGEETLENHLLARRAVLGIDGKFSKRWAFELAYDFALGGEFNDAFVRYDAWKDGWISAGQFKVPFGMERLVSSNDITFIERALPVGAFAQSRRRGVSINQATDRYSASVMRFGSSIGEDQGNGYAARLTYNLGRDQTQLLHVGLAATSERAGEEVNIRAYPESRATDLRLVRTGDLDDVERIRQTGLEAGWKSGPFLIQSEWMQANIRRTGFPADTHLDGWYVSGAWSLTGESRRYKEGRFRGLETDNSGGAWELALRYSRLDLNDDPVSGGRQRNVTFGCNWYAKNYFRVMLNYIKVRSERREEAFNPNILLLRTQIAF